MNISPLPTLAAALTIAVAEAVALPAHHRFLSLMASPHFAVLCQT